MWKRFLPFLVLAGACFPALAQQLPDCTIYGFTNTSGLHANSLVVDANRALTLEVSCNYTSADPSPIYMWDTGDTAAFKGVTAPSTAGGTQVYSVVVTQGSSQRTFSFRLSAAAAGTPRCLVVRDVGVDVPIFRAVHLTAQCDNATAYQWTGGFDVRNATAPVATVVNVVNQPASLQSAVDLIPSNSVGVGAMVENAGEQFQTDMVFAGLLIFAAAGMVLTAIVRWLERRFDSWRV